MKITILTESFHRPQKKKDIVMSHDGTMYISETNMGSRIAPDKRIVLVYFCIPLYQEDGLIKAEVGDWIIVSRFGETRAPRKVTQDYIEYNPLPMRGTYKIIATNNVEIMSDINPTEKGVCVPIHVLKGFVKWNNNNLNAPSIHDNLDLTSTDFGLLGRDDIQDAAANTTLMDMAESNPSDITIFEKGFEEGAKYVLNHTKFL